MEESGIGTCTASTSSRTARCQYTFACLFACEPVTRTVLNRRLEPVLIFTPSPLAVLCTYRSPSRLGLGRTHASDTARPVGLGSRTPRPRTGGGASRVLGLMSEGPPRGTSGDPCTGPGDSTPPSDPAGMDPYFVLIQNVTCDSDRPHLLVFRDREDVWTHPS